MWIGPFENTKIINKKNVEVKIKNRSQIYNVCRLKNNTDPENSKVESTLKIIQRALTMNIRNWVKMKWKSAKVLMI